MKKSPPEPLYTFHGEMAPIHCLLPLLSELEELLYLGTQEGKVHVWDLKMKREIIVHDVGSYPCLSILKAHADFITQQKGDSIKFWTETNRNWRLLKIISIDYCGFCKMSLLNDLIFVPDFNCKMWIYDLKRSTEIFVKKEEIDSEKLGQVMCMKCVQLNEIQQMLFVAYESGAIHLYDSKCLILTKNKFSSDCPMAMDFCERTREGIMGTVSETFYKFVLNNSSEDEGKDLILTKVGEGRLTNPGVGSVALHSTGKLVVLGCWDAQIRYYSMKSLQLLAVLSHHRAPLSAVAFLPGSGRLVAASSDRRASLWDLYSQLLVDNPSSSSREHF